MIGSNIVNINVDSRLLQPVDLKSANLPVFEKQNAYYVNVVKVPKGKEDLVNDLIEKDGADNVSFKLEDGTNFVATGLNLKTNPIKEGAEITFNCKKGVVTAVNNEINNYEEWKDNHEKLATEYDKSTIADVVDVARAVVGATVAGAVKKVTNSNAISVTSGFGAYALTKVPAEMIKEAVVYLDIKAEKRNTHPDVNLIKNTLEPEKK